MIITIILLLFYRGKPINPQFLESIYSEFRNYVIKKVDTNEINLELPLKKQIDQLKTSLANAGLTDVVKDIDNIRSKLRASILQVLLF